MIETIYHGSTNIIEKPKYGLGKANNDYGRGFYCTREIELAKEWACKNGSDGFVNRYSLDLEMLKVLNLNSDEYNILNWLALLTKNRGYWQAKSIAEQAKDYLQEKYLIDTTMTDVIIGYRADDSYFSFAQDFIMGTISLQKLALAMKLGKLGEQVVLMSPKAFDSIKYVGSELVMSEIYYTKKLQRDIEARRGYADYKNQIDYMNDIFIVDILRGRVKDEDLRV